MTRRTHDIGLDSSTTPETTSWIEGFTRKTTRLGAGAVGAIVFALTGCSGETVATTEKPPVAAVQPAQQEIESNQEVISIGQGASFEPLAVSDMGPDQIAPYLNLFTPSDSPQGALYQASKWLIAKARNPDANIAHNSFATDDSPILEVFTQIAEEAGLAGTNSKGDTIAVCEARTAEPSLDSSPLCADVPLSEVYPSDASPDKAGLLVVVQYSMAEVGPKVTLINLDAQGAAGGDGSFDYYAPVGVEQGEDGVLRLAPRQS